MNQKTTSELSECHPANLRQHDLKSMAVFGQLVLGKTNRASIVMCWWSSTAQWEGLILVSQPDW